MSFTHKFAERVKSIRVSPIKMMPLKAQAVPDALSLGQGIPALNTPAHVVEEVCSLLKTDDKVGKYSLQPGLPELKAALAHELSTDHWRIDPENEIYISAGGMEALFTALVSIIEPEDEVIVFDPSYSSHIEQIVFAGGVPKFVPLASDNNWSFSEEDLEAAFSSKTKAMILCNPGNPTGKVFSRQELEKIVALVEKHDIYLVADETYDFLTYESEFISCRAFEKIKSQLILCGSFSKRFSMTGWRLGYLQAGAEVIEQALKVHDAAVICAPTISQYAGLIALKHPRRQQEEQSNLATMSRRRDLMCSRLNKLSKWFSFNEPEGAYYILARYKQPEIDSTAFADRMLYEAGVIVIPGSAFGPAGEGHIRFSFGGTEELIGRAFDRIESWLNREFK